MNIAKNFHRKHNATFFDILGKIIYQKKNHSENLLEFPKKTIGRLATFEFWKCAAKNGIPALEGYHV